MELNSQVTTFVKGMNLDDALSMIDKNQYREAWNVRLLANNQGTSGVLQNIENICKYNGKLNSSEQILGTATTRWYNNDKIEECGVIVTKAGNYNNIWVVTDFDTATPTWKLIVSAKMNLTGKLSIVTNYEQKSVSKVYMTDGNSGIKVLNISGDFSGLESPIENESFFDILPEATLYPAEFVDFGKGAMPAGSVQYCYQLFTLHGEESVVSPLSGVIPISKYLIENSYSDIKGQLRGENSELSCNIRFQFLNINKFDKLRIIRVHYEQNEQIPQVYIVNEIDIVDKTGIIEVTYNDNGSEFMNSLSFDEFRAIIPHEFTAQTLAKLQNRLFAANISESDWDIEYDARAYRCNQAGIVLLQDSNSANEIEATLNEDGTLSTGEVPYNHDCINPYNILGNSKVASWDQYKYAADRTKLGGTGINISYEFTFTEAVLSHNASVGTENDPQKYSDTLNIPGSSRINRGDTVYFYDINGQELSTETATTSYMQYYADAYYCSKYTGYMRDEIYRFGIVFYNKKGIASPVHWIGDIRMPNVHDASDITSLIYPFHANEMLRNNYGDVELTAYPLGIKFTVNNVNSDEVTGWEIVRCDRGQLDRTVVTQGIMGTLIRFDSWENSWESGNITAGIYAYGTNDIRPKPLFNMASTWDPAFRHGDDWDLNTFITDNKCFEFVSPEICVSGDTIKSQLTDSSLKRLYEVSCANKTVVVDGATSLQLGVKQQNVETLWAGEPQANDAAFSCLTEVSGATRPYFFKTGYGNVTEKQALYKYYRVKVLSEDKSVAIKDATVGNILPHRVTLEETKSYAQFIGNKAYINASIGGYEQFSIHGPNAILSFEYDQNITINNGTYSDRFNGTCTSYIANIKKNIIPYGGNSFANRQNSIYISCNAYSKSDDNTVNCFGGDTYLNIFDYLNTAVIQTENNPETGSWSRMCTVCYVPLESVVNTSLFVSESYHNDATATHGPNLIQHEPVVLSNGYSQENALYVYNTAYSTSSEGLDYVSKSIYAEDDLENITRITASELKTNNELSDSWTVFKFANYLDVDTAYGPVTNLKTFKNHLYYFQDSAVGIAAVNERSLITDNNPGELTLGTGDILPRFDYLLVTNGSSVCNDYSITNSEYSLYWYDYDKNTLCALNNGTQFVELSKLKKVQKHLNENISKDRSNSLTFFDKKYNEIWFRVFDEELIYNESLQVFTSFYSHTPDWCLPFSDKTVTIKDNECYRIHDSELNGLINKEDRTAKIQFVINDNFMYTKVFDNVIFSAEFSKDGEYISPILTDIVFKTKTQDTLSIDFNNIELREDNYRFPIPREKAVADNQQQLSQSYLGRMRGKYLICDYTFDCNNDREFKLPYIKTTYRYSML